MFHPSIEGVLRFFEYRHLPPHLRVISEPFGLLAKMTAERTLDPDKPADGPETTVALRKLLEAKDAAVRAMLPPA